MAYKAKKKSKTAGKPRTFNGKLVEDAKTPLPFVVTNQDCKRGKPNKPGDCAGAVALKRLIPGCIGVYVHRSATFVEFKDKVVRYATSGPLRDQVIRYDAAKKFDVGPYKLLPPTKAAIAARGSQHSAPDRMRGDPASPKARQKALTLRHHVGRQAFHFTTENSDFRA